MMKRTGVPRLGPDDPQQMQQPNPAQIQQPGSSSMHALPPQAAPQQILGTTTMMSVQGSGFGRGGAARAPSVGPPVINYMKPGAVQYAPAKQPPPQVPPRIKQAPQPSVVAGRQSPGPQTQFQRLKVEDALSYLDQVKYKFNTQPQVYNDFLDIMKEFKSQTIDTPGVITRVSNLFKGHPELIVGFNTFLPPGYKIEVKSDGQVSVSMPSPTGMNSGVLLGVHHQPQPPLVHLLPSSQPVTNSMVHNLSVSGPGTNTLHQISHAHQQMEAAVHHAPGGPGGAPTPPGQPVEFNHAIEYVNKIKSRFSRQPDKYKRFLEILHAYQRGQRDLKEPQAKQQTEQEVYSQVAKLFENQEDLLAEFGQFLPDAKAVTKPPDRPATPPLQQQRIESDNERFQAVPAASPPLHLTPISHAQIPKHTSAVQSIIPPPVQHHGIKRSPSFSSSGPREYSQATSLPAGMTVSAMNVSSNVGPGQGSAGGQSLGGPPAKRARSTILTGPCVRDVSYAEASKHATHHEFSFFDRTKKALRSQNVYDNFLRCLMLFTNEIISSSELLSVTAPFLCRYPELHKWLQDFLGPPSPPHTPTAIAGNNTNALHSGYNWTSATAGAVEGRNRFEPVGPLGAQLRHERPQADIAMDIDLSTCKRLGTSYCALPRAANPPRCSGRTALCKEVLNDTWVSFPTWSEDSTFVTSRKTQYEEYIYRCEDERFELDVVIETNASTIRALEGVHKKLARMAPEDAAKHRLDDNLGGHSPTIHQRALRRIYGDKVAADIIAGLKKNPAVAVPVVLRRLKAKEEEWREAQKGFNKTWREQNEKYYLKSLDHQGINFKQNDLKAMRSKTLFNEVESAYAARRPGPHVVVDYDMRSRQEAIKIVRDTAELLIHHARRQTGIQKAEKRRIKQLLRQFLPDLFAHPRQPLSDDERDDEDKEDLQSPGSPSADQNNQENDKSNSNIKQDIKQESSESDNASDRSSKMNKNNKENKPKNNNTDNKERTGAQPNSVKRSSSNEEQAAAGGRVDFKSEPHDPYDDLKDYPPNEGRFVCTASWYLFLRVHGTLCQRLAAARRTALALAAEAARERTDVADTLRLKPPPFSYLPIEVSSPSEYYGAILEIVRLVLDGNMDASTFEDTAREMLGIKAYPAFTLDKLVSIAVRQLQHVVAEPWSMRAAEMCSRGMRGPLSYVRRAARQLRGDHTAFLVKVYGGDECKVTFELLESAGEGRTSPHNNDTSRLSPTSQGGCPGGGGSVGGGVGAGGAAALVSSVRRAGAWSAYAERYARGPSSSPPSLACHKPVFLGRNARARGGSGAPAGTTGALQGPATVAPRHGRRKPPRLLDASECTLAANLRWRAVACRPFSLYQAGALASARASQNALAAKRRERFRQWLRRKRHHAD